MYICLYQFHTLPLYPQCFKQRENKTHEKNKRILHVTVRTCQCKSYLSGIREERKEQGKFEIFELIWYFFEENV